MGKKKSRARVQIVWVSRSHVVLKLHKSVLARLTHSFDECYEPPPFPLDSLESIMENPKLANGARFFWNHPRRNWPGKPGLRHLERDGGGKATPGPNRLMPPRLHPKSPAPTTP